MLRMSAAALWLRRTTLISWLSIPVRLLFEAPLLLPTRLVLRLRTVLVAERPTIVVSLIVVPLTVVALI